MAEILEESLSQRVERLEKNNRILLVGLVATCLAFLLTWGLGAAGGTTADTIEARKIVAQEVSIVDAAGDEVGSFRVATDELDTKCVLAVGSLDDGVVVKARDDGGIVNVHANRFHAEAQLVASRIHGSNANVSFAEGKVASIFADGDGPCFTLVNPAVQPSIRRIEVRKKDDSNN